MAATAAAMRAPSTLFSRRRRYIFPALGNNVLIIQTTTFWSSVTVRASDPQREQQEEKKDEIKSQGAFTSQEDLGYLWKLGAGSVIGAAAIKYGSVLFPTITKPNIVEALIIIFVPVFVAVLLLFNQSLVKK